MFDTHMHTQFSSDSKMTIEEVVECVKKQDIGVIITEHMDLDFPGDFIFEFNPQAYFEAYGRYRSDKLLLGIEVGLVLSAVQKNKEIVTSYPFDFVLGSIHTAYGTDLCMNQPYYEAHTKQQAYTAYFQAMYENVKAFDEMDSLGHLDYISRYAAYPDSEITYSDFKTLIDPVLQLVVDKGIALEINTRRLGMPSAVENMRTILQRYKECGGNYVTCGSDAHQQAHIGGYLQDAYALAEAVGLQPVYFKERQMQYCKL